MVAGDALAQVDMSELGIAPEELAHFWVREDEALVCDIRERPVASVGGGPYRKPTPEDMAMMGWRRASELRVGEWLALALVLSEALEQCHDDC